MKKVLFRTDEFNNCESIADVKAVIENNEEMLERINLLASTKSWGTGDAIEAVATHIIYTNEDFNLIPNW